MDHICVIYFILTSCNALSLLSTHISKLLRIVCSGAFHLMTDFMRMEWNITRSGPVVTTRCGQIKYLRRIVIGLYLGFNKEDNISLPGGKIVGPPYWQIKWINPFFILNPFPYHKIMKIQIPPSSQMLNCTHDITPGLKRKKREWNI